MTAQPGESNKLEEKKHQGKKLLWHRNRKEHHKFHFGCVFASSFDFRIKTQETNRPVGGRRRPRIRAAAAAATAAPRTHINQVRQVVDVVFEDGGVGRFQSQQVLVARFDRLELVLRVLGLTLMKRVRRKDGKTDHNKVNRGGRGI